MENEKAEKNYIIDKLNEIYMHFGLDKGTNVGLSTIINTINRRMYKLNKQVNIQTVEGEVVSYKIGHKMGNDRVIDALIDTLNSTESYSSIENVLVEQGVKFIELNKDRQLYIGIGIGGFCMGNIMDYVREHGCYNFYKELMIEEIDKMESAVTTLYTRSKNGGWCSRYELIQALINRADKVRTIMSISGQTDIKIGDIIDTTIDSLSLDEVKELLSIDDVRHNITKVAKHLGGNADVCTRLIVHLCKEGSLERAMAVMYLEHRKYYNLEANIDDVCIYNMFLDQKDIKLRSAIDNYILAQMNNIRIFETEIDLVIKRIKWALSEELSIFNVNSLYKDFKEERERAGSEQGKRNEQAGLKG